MKVYSDDCSGCRPVLLDIKTSMVLGDDTPEMQKILRIWDLTTRNERNVYHRVCCQNSRNPRDIAIFLGITSRMKVALTADDPTEH
jgi:hypothetical protein